MMKKKLTVFIFALVFAAAVTITLAMMNAEATRGGEGGRGDGPVILVTSQWLCFDSIVTADPLPQKGPFQQLFPPGTNPDFPSLSELSTEFGPGDPGYKGGRWWVDVNGNNDMDEGDHFFSCPLLPPGFPPPSE